MTDVQVAVWFRRKPCLYIAVFTALDVLENDVYNKILWSFSAHELMIVDKACGDKKQLNEALLLPVKPHIASSPRSQTKSRDAFFTVARELHRPEKPPVAGKQITFKVR